MATSTDFKESAYRQERTDVVLPLLKIDHADLAAPIRVVYNNEDVISNGNTFLATWFSLSLPLDDPEAAPRAKLEIDNVSQQIVIALRSISTPATVDIQIVRSTAPDVIEVEYFGLDLKNVSYDASKVSADLTFESFVGEPYPYARFDPARFPGAF